MNVSIAPYPRFRAFVPGTGDPLSGGQLYTVQPGTNVQFGLPPAYPLPTYTDSTGLVQNANPVVLDASGEADVWLSGYTKLVLFDAEGILVWSEDNVSSNPALQSASLQWVPQSTQVAFIDAARFSVPGNQTGVFVPGTAIQAAIAGGTIYGIISASSSGGTPIVTTVSVAWFSTQLNSSVTQVALGIITAGFPTALPVLPVVTKTDNYTIAYSDLFQTILANKGSAISFTLPAANTVPSGSWIKIKNIGSGTLTITGTVDGAANPTMSAWQEKMIFSDGTSWYGKTA